MLRIPFEWLEFAFERVESLSNGSNLHSNASNSFRMLRIPFEWLGFELECFELLSNASNLFRIVQICIGSLVGSKQSSW